jgi:two-component system, chemotaxis family, response regulator Rcp1
MKEVHILLVEDNEGDIILTREALKEARIKNEIIVARDGEEALELLHTTSSLPDIILLDINLPKINGLEVLANIKNNDRLKSIPVIMLSTSSSERDITNSYHNHANCFITKPVDLNKFMELVKSIEDFWISIVKLPKYSPGS